MRDCPVCKSSERVILWRSDFVHPDGWTQPDYLDWCRCKCGMIYGDNPDITQKDYDTYYIERYGYGVVEPDGAPKIDGLHDQLRQRGLYVAENYDKDARVIDFGGGESGLPEQLRELGFDNVSLVGCGDELPPSDVIIAHHVFEHIYDIDEAMEKIKGSLVEGGIFLIDIPDSGAMALSPKPYPMSDWTQVHINHFRVIDMIRMMERFGFELKDTQGYPARFGPARMFVFINDSEAVYKGSGFDLSDKMAKLRDLGNREVIVWGFGDIAAHLLANVWPNVQYFCCNDPAFQDATIRGLPVYEKPITDHPIVIMAQVHQDRLIENIKKMGVENEIIVI